MECFFFQKNREQKFSKFPELLEERFKVRSEIEISRKFLVMMPMTDGIILGRFRVFTLLLRSKFIVGKWWNDVCELVVKTTLPVNNSKKGNKGGCVL